MSGFILESLFPTGWRRNGEIYWRYVDAMRAAKSRLSDDDARGVRIVPIRIGESPVYESLVDESEKLEGGSQ